MAKETKNKAEWIDAGYVREFAEYKDGENIKVQGMRANIRKHPTKNMHKINVCLPDGRWVSGFVNEPFKVCKECESKSAGNATYCQACGAKFADAPAE